MGVFVFEPCQTHLGDVAASDFLTFGFVRAAQFEPKGDIAYHGRPRHQCKVLKHEGAFGSGRADALSIDLDRSSIGLYQARDDLQERRLSAAARSEKAGQLAAWEIKIDSAQRLDIAVGLGKPLHLNDEVDRIEHRCRSLSQCTDKHDQAPLFSGLKTATSTHCRKTSVRVESPMIEAIVAYISA